ncbi:lipoprotein LpqO [Mycobacterium tuberculosis variant africanum]|nr:lipoprotein LpqO [Mycobacterium tuberculosis variant africanum]
MAALLAAAALALTACAGSDDKGEPDDGGTGAHPWPPPAMRTGSRWPTFSAEPAS